MTGQTLDVAFCFSHERVRHFFHKLLRAQHGTNHRSLSRKNQKVSGCVRTARHCAAVRRQRQRQRQRDRDRNSQTKIGHPQLVCAPSARKAAHERGEAQEQRMRRLQQPSDCCVGDSGKLRGTSLAASDSTAEEVLVQLAPWLAAARSGKRRTPLGTITGGCVAATRAIAAIGTVQPWWKSERSAST